MCKLKVGVTGGIGAGKSTVGKIFRLLGIPIYEADAQARKVMERNEALIHEIKRVFGEDVYTKEGKLNRRCLAKSVFHHTHHLNTLNQLVHPKVAADFDRWVEAQHNAPYIIKVAALLFEADSYKKLDKIITVLAPELLRVRRIKLRDTQRTEEEIQAIISRQWSDEEKSAHTDFIIHNDEQRLLIPQVLRLHKILLR
ncbi:MAG: dephospho-CoA kinase [Cytophagales bacterium]|nr:dephospho-CoA kinase [Cytophagales bacterium]